MSAEQAGVALAAAAICWVAARAVAGRILRTHPARLMRVNVRGRRVPAVLGVAVVIAGSGGVVGLALIRALTEAGHVASPRMLVAVGLVTGVMGLAGAIDDLQGDERSRGFAGHLAALKRGRLTGGIVKLLAGGLVGLVAGALLVGQGMFGVFGSDLVDFREGGWNQVWRVIEVGAFVALSANLVNLLDRAPGRAMKFSLALAVACVVFARSTWTVAAAPLLGAALGVFRLDLREKGMLGDGGVNPIGGVIGVGLATFPAEARWVMLAGLVALNAASEKWSFSRLIEKTPILARVDGWGRTTSPDEPSR